MHYIKAIADGENHGNPQSRAFPGCAALPDALLGDYIAAKGFVYLTLDGGTVTAVTVNQEALDAYDDAHPVTPTEPSVMDMLEAQVLYTALMTDTLLESEE